MNILYIVLLHNLVTYVRCHGFSEITTQSVEYGTETGFDPTYMYPLVDDVPEENTTEIEFDKNYTSPGIDEQSHIDFDLYNETEIREEDFCSFTKFEEKILETPDPEECKKMNERFKENENFMFINYFGEIFRDLKTGIDSLKYPELSSGENPKALYFVGNTGSGKSTLVQILTGDNSKIYSAPAYETEDFLSTDLIITDYSKIGTNTINSQTLYPEISIDQETGYVLVDNPGFRDSRSPVHEIIAALGMRKVLDSIGKIKIIIVVNHDSLKKGMYRDDFKNLLVHLSQFFHGIDRYKKSVYLIGTKVKNVFKRVNKTMLPVPDNAVITGISKFLSEVRDNLINKSISVNLTTINEDDFFKYSTKIIDTLLEKEGDKFSRINILRQPNQEGPLSNISMIQDERTILRENLLNENNMVEVRQRDLGFSLTDSAANHLNDIFNHMNSYINRLSDIIGEYMKNHYENAINSSTNITYVLEFVKRTKVIIKNLSGEIGISKNPGQYAQIVSNFSEKNKLKLECLTTLQNISVLNDYLVNLEDLSVSSEYTPSLWSGSIQNITKFLETKEEQYNLLHSIFQVITSYDYQKSRYSYYSNEQVNQTTVQEILSKTDLKSRYEHVRFDDILLANINSVLNLSSTKEPKVICNDDILFVINYLILFSELNNEYFISCNATKISILAMHTVFIDKDLTEEWFKGKDLTIIAPVWIVIGTRVISIDGMDGGNKLPKASTGEIGRNGNSGKPGGNFAGIGKVFKNSNHLTVSACGGSGQDGQDGGDGMDGKPGQSATENDIDKTDTGGFTFFGFMKKTSLGKGYEGRAGGDAGAGGFGGPAGKKGSATIHNIGMAPHRIHVTVENGVPGENGNDGNPGKGGVRGCDRSYSHEKRTFFFIPIWSSTTSEVTNCNDRNPDGNVKRPKVIRMNNDTISNNDSPVCIHIQKFQSFYRENFDKKLTDGISRSFINDIKLTKY